MSNVIARHFFFLGVHLVGYYLIYYLFLIYEHHSSIFQFIAFNQKKKKKKLSRATIRLLAKMVGSVFINIWIKSIYQFIYDDDVHRSMVDTQVEPIIYDDDDEDDDERHLVKCFFFFCFWFKRDVIVLICPTFDIYVCWCWCLPVSFVNMECMYVYLVTKKRKRKSDDEPTLSWWQVARWCLTHLIACHHSSSPRRLTLSIFVRFFFVFVCHRCMQMVDLLFLIK